MHPEADVTKCPKVIQLTSVISSNSITIPLAILAIMLPLNAARNILIICQAHTSDATKGVNINISLLCLETNFSKTVNDHHHQLCSFNFQISDSLFKEVLLSAVKRK